MTRSLALALVALLALAAFARSQQPPQSYHVAGRIPLAGEGGWDYLTVDTVAHRLYVSRGTHVAVIDLDRDSVVGDIPNTNGVHGIAFVRELNRGFTSNGRDTTVTIFDLKTLAPIAVVKVTGRNPDAITYDPVSRRVFTFNGGGANATAIDPQSGAVVGSGNGSAHAAAVFRVLQWSHGGRRSRRRPGAQDIADRERHGWCCVRPGHGPGGQLQRRGDDDARARGIARQLPRRRDGSAAARRPDDRIG